MGKGKRMAGEDVRARLTVKSDDGNDEADGENEDNKGVDLETGGFVGVESCRKNTC